MNLALNGQLSHSSFPLSVATIKSLEDAARPLTRNIDQRNLQDKIETLFIALERAKTHEQRCGFIFLLSHLASASESGNAKLGSIINSKFQKKELPSELLYLATISHYLDEDYRAVQYMVSPLQHLFNEVYANNIQNGSSSSAAITFAQSVLTRVALEDDPSNDILDLVQADKILRAEIIEHVVSGLIEPLKTDHIPNIQNTALLCRLFGLDSETSDLLRKAIIEKFVENGPEYATSLGMILNTTFIYLEEESVEYDDDVEGITRAKYAQFAKELHEALSHYIHRWAFNTLQMPGQCASTLCAGNQIAGIQESLRTSVQNLSDKEFSDWLFPLLPLIVNDMHGELVDTLINLGVIKDLFARINDSGDEPMIALQETLLPEIMLHAENHRDTFCTQLLDAYRIAEPGQAMRLEEIFVNTLASRQISSDAIQQYSENIITQIALILPELEERKLSDKITNTAPARRSKAADAPSSRMIDSIRFAASVCNFAGTVPFAELEGRNALRHIFETASKYPTYFSFNELSRSKKPNLSELQDILTDIINSRDTREVIDDLRERVIFSRYIVELKTGGRFIIVTPNPDDDMKPGALAGHLLQESLIGKAERKIGILPSFSLRDALAGYSSIAETKGSNVQDSFILLAEVFDHLHPAGAFNAILAKRLSQVTAKNQHYSIHSPSEAHGLLSAPPTDSKEEPEIEPTLDAVLMCLDSQATMWPRIARPNFPAAFTRIVALDKVVDFAEENGAGKMSDFGHHFVVADKHLHNADRIIVILEDDTVPEFLVNLAKVKANSSDTPPWFSKLINNENMIVVASSAFFNKLIQQRLATTELSADDDE